MAYSSKQKLACGQLVWSELEAKNWNFGQSSAKPLCTPESVAHPTDRKSFTATKLAHLAVKKSYWSVQRFFEMSYLRSYFLLFPCPLGFFPRWDIESKTFPNFPPWFCQVNWILSPQLDADTQDWNQFDCAFLDKHFKTCQPDMGASPTWLPHLAAVCANPRRLCAGVTHFSFAFFFPFLKLYNFEINKLFFFCSRDKNQNCSSIEF